MLSAIYANKKHNEEGFTLLELLIVVIVIGILAAIALPIFLNQQRAAVDASVQSDVRNTVAQIVGAQTTNEATVPATLSRAGTTLSLLDTTDASKTSKVSEGNANTSLATPGTDDAYTLAGYNPAGGKFQGPSAENGKSFIYNGATGKFDTGAVPGLNATSSSSTAYSTSFEESNYVKPGGLIRDVTLNFSSPNPAPSDSLPAHSGAQVLAGGENYGSSAFGINMQNLVPGDTVTVEGWYYLKSDSPDTSKITGLNLQYAGADGYQHNVDLPRVFNSWQKFSATFTLKDGANMYMGGSSMNLYAQISTPTRLLIDDLSVTRS